MNDADNIFDTGLAALFGALGIAAGWLLSGELAFPMYCALAGIGVVAMIGGVGLRDLRYRRYAAEMQQRSADMVRRWEAIQEHLVGIDDAIVETTLRELVEAGRGA